MSLSRVQGLLRQLLHLDEPPHRTARAFAVGVFVTFSPAYGLHMIMALLCVWAFRLNMPAVVAGLCLNTPWTLVPTLGLTLWLGCALLGVPVPTTLDWSDTSASGIVAQAVPYAVPFVVGGLVLSTAASIVAYPMAYWLIVRFRRSRTGGSPDDSPLPPQTDIR